MRRQPGAGVIEKKRKGENKTKKKEGTTLAGSLPLGEMTDSFTDTVGERTEPECRESQSLATGREDDWYNRTGTPRYQPIIGLAGRNTGFTYPVKFFLFLSYSVGLRGQSKLERWGWENRRNKKKRDLEKEGRKGKKKKVSSSTGDPLQNTPGHPIIRRHWSLSATGSIIL